MEPHGTTKQSQPEPPSRATTHSEAPVGQVETRLSSQTQSLGSRVGASFLAGGDDSAGTSTLARSGLLHPTATRERTDFFRTLQSRRGNLFVQRAVRTLESESPRTSAIQRQGACRECVEYKSNREESLAAEGERVPIQAKLTLSETGDPYEAEADRIANRIISTQESAVHEAPGASSRDARGGPKGAHEFQPEPQREGVLGPAASSLSLPRSFTRELGSGHPLPSGLRAAFEPHLGFHLGGVRIHTGGRAAEAARSINARAFTVGQSVAFAEGAYAPESREGRHLLAHELTHVIQQGGDGSRRPPEPEKSSGVEPRSLRGMQRFASTEHEELGDTTGIKTIDLGHGVVLSWGQVVALAGDYYGTVEDLLADTITAAGRAKIRAAMEQGGLPSVKTTTLPAPGPAEKTALMTQYLKLVVQNIPHFLLGGTARKTWLEYHTRAIDTAVRAGLAGTPIDHAYLLEAFGEHFYTDSFSGGHIRTPRKAISDWYRTVFAPRVVDHFINTLRDRVENEVYYQVAGLPIAVMPPSIGIPAELIVRHKIHEAVGKELAAAIASIGGRAKLIEWFGLGVGGMISGPIHDLEGDRGVVVNSKAHPASWTAYGDGKLDDPRNTVSRSEAVAGVSEAKADVDQAYLIGQSEALAKTHAHIPVASALPSTIYFHFDSSALSSKAAAEMGGALSYMTYNPGVAVSIEGYTDPIGTPSYNLGLGGQRADAVASVLLKGGIDPKRVAAKSGGETGLVATKPPQYWRDRRVELSWTWATSGPAAMSHDVAYDRAMAKVKSRIGPPYWAEKRFPEPVAGANPAIPEWHWGKIDPGFQKEIASYVTDLVKHYSKDILALKALDPKPFPVAGTSVTVEPRPIVKGILDDLMADPIDFLNKAFGEKAGP